MPANREGAFIKATTPIWDFLNDYADSKTARFHMPAHKGVKNHGLEPLDITEIKNADYLYESQGIIKRSEDLTASIFGAQQTLYSTEGSSCCIKTMLGIVAHCRKNFTARLKVIAPRNAHRAFINACALLDIDVVWVYPSQPSKSICACEVSPDDIELAIVANPDCEAVYITSPDYLGNLADIAGISAVCKKHGIPLLVDNAHGAYLKFLDTSLHPLDLGADLCCDSAHKTLPVYTGGAYLHISHSADERFWQCAKSVMSMFASTSPSYLILSSLDLCCGLLQRNLPEQIREACRTVLGTCKNIANHDWNVADSEPMKITIYPNSFGYTGDELADILRNDNIECEFSDSLAIVFMCSPFNSHSDFSRLENALINLKRKLSIKAEYQDIPKAKAVMSIRKALFSPSEEIPTDEALGRICAKTALSCQPSIPIIVSGEIFTSEIIAVLKGYNIYMVNVLC